MRFSRRQPSPLLLFLLPSLATALSPAAQDNIQSTLSKNTPTNADSKLDPAVSPLVDLTAKPKFEIGTKDAPVDGKDGKPHAGPWVDTAKDPKKDAKKDPKKPSNAKEDAELVVESKEEKKKLVNPDGTKIPEVNDGVMDDPHRQLPKVGTTGTEGGVSEKDKARKAQEGQTGEKVEKKPDSPKEAPPLPLGELSKSKGDKGDSKSKDGDAADDEIVPGGLEVRKKYMHGFKHLANSPRNLTISHQNTTTLLTQSLSPQIKTTSRSRSLVPSQHRSSLLPMAMLPRESYNHSIPISFHLP